LQEEFNQEMLLLLHQEIRDFPILFPVFG